MLIHRNLTTFPSTVTPVLTVGMFDGVHIGHHKVLENVVSLAQKHQTASVVVTFEPHPRIILNGVDNGFRILTTLDEKARLMENAGIDHLVVLPFNDELAGLSPEEFVIGVLVNALNAGIIVMGPDHHFGKGRTGGLETVKQLAEKYNFEVREIPSQDLEDVKISSTQIRKALNQGDLDKAWLFLGYPYPISGRVVEGEKIGRTIGFPTLNIEPHPNKLIPAHGVYAVFAEYKGQPFEGMCNIGFRPTVKGENLTIEVNLFGFDEEIYDEEIRIAFMEKIRDEIRFNNLEELKAQLIKDRLAAQQALRF
ncbi:MAG: bifunctional riboflavin kinase/FAD synthetase [Bacteroidales bacterium]